MHWNSALIRVLQKSQKRLSTKAYLWHYSLFKPAIRHEPPSFKRNCRFKASTNQPTDRLSPLVVPVKANSKSFKLILFRRSVFHQEQTPSFNFKHAAKSSEDCRSSTIVVFVYILGEPIDLGTDRAIAISYLVDIASETQ